MLEKLKAHESAHITMITFWLFEIYEKQLADAKYSNVSTNEPRQLQSTFKTLLLFPHVQVGSTFRNATFYPNLKLMD